MKFKTWFLADDIATWASFGKDRHFHSHPDLSPEETMKRGKYDQPIDLFNIESLSERLAKRKVGLREGYQKFVNEVIFGEGQGSLKINIHPDNHVAIHRLGKDLNGEDVWFTKRVFLIDRSGFGGKEEIIADELYDELNYINEEGVIEMGERNLDAKKFRLMVQKMATTMEHSAMPIFFLENIKKINDHNYIIQFGLTGQGVEAQDQRRVEANHTQVIFDKNRGLIRVTNMNIESDIGGPHSWEIMPSDSEYYFSPTQSPDEIIATMETTMRYY